MGPFPHDAPPAQITADNPMGTDGFALVEFADPQPERLHSLFGRMGFAPVAKHKSMAVTLYRQGGVDYLVNEEPGTHAAAFAAAHGPCAASMGFRVVDAAQALNRAVRLGADIPQPSRSAVRAPAIVGIGGSLLHLVDQYGTGGSYVDGDFDWLGTRDDKPEGQGLFYIDHLTHNVGRGRMDLWSDFYKNLFNFREIHYFDIKGEYTGLFSRALTSPDGAIRIPINESADDASQISEYLDQYRGEGIQHVACGCHNIYDTVERLRRAAVEFMPSPAATYYAGVDQRVPNHGEDIERLQRNGILIDGEGAVRHGTSEGHMTKVLLQIFSKTAVGPIFFEFIQRKGDEGFGEGNFRALFVSIEEDQLLRGVISAKA